ncbi:hypothetical protein JH06_5036 [Blastocystis sp. subtype 4]|uniref:hypothetical protein n=1 Tax=Blastocystis sp. subtype 4 TaxID=944170 RepID=UPI0007115FA8|nr:hypothetical protein JH06_5036 [Blastocystis sp. subtype 4]KNB41541.1 hypothetical protein JH06_5036 [Blastocystis sp. subtype 4]|eukprot:XP_014524984.1 hypothetical protein JH06_5036 [Blastocystis sp. subtype 4]
MATESEFEAVVSEADIEAGVLPMSGNIATPAPATSDKTQSISSGFNLLNFSGLQQYFDITTDDIINRLQASLFLWKQENALSIIEKKPDLYVPVWGSILVATLLRIGYDGRNTYDFFFDFYWHDLLFLAFISASLWVISVYLGDSISLFSCISFSSYVTLGSNLVFVLLKFIFNIGKKNLFHIYCVLSLALIGGMCYFSLYERLADLKGTIGKCCCVAYALIAYIFLLIQPSWYLK